MALVKKLGEDFGYSISNEDSSKLNALTTGTLYIRKNSISGDVAFTKAFTLSDDRSNIFVKVLPDEALLNLEVARYKSIIKIDVGGTERQIFIEDLQIIENGIPA